MGDIERHGRLTHVEGLLDPRHFYAAYVFDQAESREGDVSVVLEHAARLGYPVRYWWLSEAMELQGFPDRLIVCVHHPSTSFDAGMDLLDALMFAHVTWNDLEAAAVEEYRDFGQPANNLPDLHFPDGNPLFPTDE